jgi:hypothetical protein
MKPRHGRSVRLVITTLLLWILSTSIIASERETDTSGNCDIRKGACIQTLESGTVTLDILSKPVTAMTDLTFNITLENLAPVDDPFIDLGMPGMKMGPNQVLLQKTSEGVYTGTGVIVRCASGRTLWRADVTIPGVGKTAFTFDVVY